MPVSARAVIVRRRLLGALVLVGAVVAVVLLWKRPDPFATREVIRADVANASGLAAIGAEVRVAGVPVGKVTGISRAGNVAQLTLTIDPSAGVVHRDATIALRPRMMFEGTAYVQLDLGSPAAAPIGRAVIPVSQSSVYVPLDDALSVLRAPTRANVRTVAGGLAGLLSASTPAQLRDAIAAGPALTADTAAVARAARGPDATELRSAVSSYANVASAVASRVPALESTLRATDDTFAALNAAGDRPLDRALGALGATVNDVRAGARASSAIVGELQGLIPRLDPGVAQLPETIAAVRPLLRRSVPAMAELSPALGEIETALTGARQGASPALAAIRATQPIFEIYQDTLLNALSQQTDLGDPAYLAFLGLFAGGGGASRPFGVDGQGHLMRFGLRFLTGAGQPLPPCTLVQAVSPSVAAELETAGGCTP